MKKPQITPVKIAPATITYINGKAKVQITISNTKLTDWVSKQTLQNMIDIKTRTLPTLRSTNHIPCTKIGNKIFYYMPGILALLENNILYKITSKPESKTQIVEQYFQHIKDFKLPVQKSNHSA